MTETETTRVSRHPSPIFLGLVAISAISGWALFTGAGGAGAAGPIAFVFILAAWVVSLCLHEFAHAVVAYRYGDTSVAYRGYLTLDPLKYTHPVFSIVLPLIFVLLGGIGLPGGAVFIDQRALRTRFARSAVSAAGPLTNLLIAVVLAIAIGIGFRALVGGGSGSAAAASAGTYEFWAALGFLLFLQVTATILNLLPVPGLDGFGIIAPYLPVEFLALVSRVAPFAILILFALLWIPAVNQAFFGAIFGLANALGVPGILIGSGYGLFQFWR